MSLPWMLFTLSNTNGSSLSAFEVVEMVNEGPWAVEDFVKGMETALTVLRLPARPAAVSQSASFAELESMAAARVLSGEEGGGKKYVWLFVVRRISTPPMSLPSASWYRWQCSPINPITCTRLRSQPVTLRAHRLFIPGTTTSYSTRTNIRTKQKNSQGVWGHFCERRLETTRTLGQPHTFLSKSLGNSSGLMSAVRLAG